MIVPSDHEKNRIAWNEMAEIYYHHLEYKVTNGFCYPAGGPPRYPLIFSLRATRA